MQITDLLVPERVALNMQVADKAMAIHAMVGMLDLSLIHISEPTRRS